MDGKEHLPNAMTDGPVAVTDPLTELMESAEQEGIPAAEINEKSTASIK
ncbi:hypothetical protein [Mesorhizobium sp. WSM4313]|nr:hypothetical protein [Mesorhizobium sp. WSM4313]